MIKGIELKRQSGKKLPLYEQINDGLKVKIESGVFSPGERLPSISEMANSWKVDFRTVNSALKMLEGEGYIRCEAGRGKGPMVIKGASRKVTLGFLRWCSDSMPMQVTQGIKQFSRNEKTECIVLDVASNQAVCEALGHLHSEGILVSPYEDPSFVNAVKKYMEIGGKVVFIDRDLPGIEASSVSIDHVDGAYQATRHLLDTHQLPVYFFDDAISVSSAKERQAGWAIAMREYNYRDLDGYGLKPHKKVDPFADHQAFHRAYYETARELFESNRGNKYNIFTINDYVASAVYDAARDRDLTVGRDVFLVGFGDYPFCKQLPVPLSSVLQKNELVGYQAAEMLYMAIVGASTGPIHRRIPTELCIRESSGIK